jgi:hypothetical protein
MSQQLCAYSIELAGDGEVSMVHIGEQQEDGYFLEVVEFEVDVNGLGARLAIPISDEGDRQALMKGLVKLYNSLKAHKGKQDLIVSEEDEDEDEEA